MATERQQIRRNPLDLEKDIALGLKLPFTSERGVIFEQSFTTKEQLKTNMLNLLLTRKGERLMHPDFGTNLYDTIFEPNIESTRDTIKQLIESAVEKWLPYVRLNEINVSIQLEGQERADGDHFITIQVKFSLKIDEPSNFDVIEFQIGR